MRTHNDVPAPFHNPAMPSARQTCFTASKKPFTLSVLYTPWSHIHTTSPSTALTSEDMFRTHDAGDA